MKRSHLLDAIAHVQDSDVREPEPEESGAGVILAVVLAWVLIVCVLAWALGRALEPRLSHRSYSSTTLEAPAGASAGVLL